MVDDRGAGSGRAGYCAVDHCRPRTGRNPSNRPGCDVRGHDRCFPSPHSRRQDVDRGRGNFRLPPSAPLWTRSSRARGRRRGRSRLMAHVRPVDQPLGQPSDGGTGHVRMRNRIHLRPACDAKRRGPGSRNLIRHAVGPCFCLLRLQRTADGLIDHTEAGGTSTAPAAASESRLAWSGVRSECFDRLPPVCHFRPVRRWGTARRGANHRDVSVDAPLLLPEDRRDRARAAGGNRRVRARSPRHGAALRRIAQQRKPVP